MPISFICPKHGKQQITMDNLIHGHRCRKCGHTSTSNKLKFSVEHVIDVIENVNNNKLLNPEDYINCLQNNLKIKCGICGNEFITSFTNYIRHDVTRCRACSSKESVGEFQIRKIFREK